MGGISIWQLLIIAVIVVLLFGTKKLRNLGGDLGSAIKGFKNAVNDDKANKDQQADQEQSAETLDNKSTVDQSVKHDNTKEKDQA